MSKKGEMSEDAQKDFAKAYVELGPTKAQEVLGLKLDTFKRYVRCCKKHGALTDRMIGLAQISEKLSIEDIKAFAKSARPVTSHMTNIDFEGDTFKFLFVTDTHLGSKYTKPDLLLQAFKEAEKQGCKAVMHAGDVTEGLSNRKDHVYQLTHVGYNEQKKHAVDILSQTKLPIHMVAGNHDLWYLKSAGAKIVEDICEELPNCHYVGDHEGSVMLNNEIEVRLWHGEDGSSYAHSYRLQKVIESLYGGDKPNILLCGHTHKMGYFFDRNIHVVSGGCIQYQSKWMRMKRLQAHVGFWIIEVTVNERGVAKFNPTFYPVYE